MLVTETGVYIGHTDGNPDSKVHGANMGPIWGRQDPGGPRVGPMNFAIWEVMTHTCLGIGINLLSTHWPLGDMALRLHFLNNYYISHGLK